MSIDKRVPLNNGVQMPQFGLGVFQSKEGSEVEKAVRSAIDFGYRHIDTAAIYGNEEGTGKAVRDSGIAREEMFITTKVWNSAQREGTVREAFEESLRKLDIGYIDLYLVHWAVEGKYVDTWLTLEKLMAEGKVKAIGVSNFYEHHFDDVLAAGSMVPAVNQVELHPYLRLEGLHNYLKDKGCYIEAWSPLAQARPELFGNPVLQTIAEEHSKTVAQVILRWHWQHDIVIIPKSVKPHRIAENGSIFDFELSAAEMSAIDGLDRNERNGPHPDNCDF